MNPSTVKDDDPRLLDLNPSLDLRIRNKSKEVFVEEELARRRQVAQLPALSPFHPSADTGSACLANAERKSCNTPTKAPKPRKRKPRSATRSVKRRKKRPGRRVGTSGSAAGARSRLPRRRLRLPQRLLCGLPGCRYRMRRRRRRKS